MSLWEGSTISLYPVWILYVKWEINNLPKIFPGTWVWSLGWEDSLEKGMATHSSILAWRILWIEEPGGLQTIGLQRVEHHWSNWPCTHENFLMNVDPSSVPRRELTPLDEILRRKISLSGDREAAVCDWLEIMFIIWNGICIVKHLRKLTQFSKYVSMNMVKALTN